MPEDAATLYQEICQHAHQTAVMSSIGELLGWDERTQMPAAGAEHRAEQSTLLAGLIHRRWIDRRFGESLDRLAEELDGEAAIVVRRLKRQRDKRVKLPQTLVEELARTAVLSQQSWEQAREQNDFPAFCPFLERTMALKRQQAESLGYHECPYEALLDEYEPEESTANIAQVLDELRKALVPLVVQIQQSGKRPAKSILHRQFPVEAQARFGREAATAIGFDFARGRLDVTAHPFCCTLGPNDCRITTRYHEDFFSAAFFGILHEAGHGLYEQGLPEKYYGLPLGESISLGIHESQSRLWENLVGRSRAFWTHFYPLAQRHFPSAFGEVAFESFYFAINDVQPSLIRIEADEATYNLHILVRFELERAMLSGDLKPADVPGAWNEKYRDYLGITPPDDRQGVLQDVHWSAGLIGYFPTYSLGNLYAAQFFEQAEMELGGLAEAFARGDFSPLLDWLRAKIHVHGQRQSAAELVERVTGNRLSPRPLVNHLRTKLSALYQL